MTQGRIEQRLKSIDFARTISILMVLAHHFGFAHDPSATAPISAWLGDFMAAFGRHGAYGVYTFFIVSGFLIARMTELRYGSIFKVNPSDFYWRRIARIWPLLFLVIVLNFLLVFYANNNNLAEIGAIKQFLSPQMSLYDPWFFVGLLTFTFNILLQVRFDEYGLVWVILWSLAVEEQFYLSFPWLCRWTGERRNLLIVLVIVFIGGMLCRALAQHFGGACAAILHSFCHFDLLALGIVLFLANEHYGTSLQTRQALCCFFFLGGFVLAASVYLFAKETILLHYVFAQSIFGLGVFLSLLGALHWVPFARIPAFLIVPGILSYGIYLYHPIVLLFVGITVTGDRLFVFGVFMLALLCVSGLSYLFFEKPCNRLIIGLTRARNEELEPG